jgi:diacylglycerol kinase (ATP)
VFPVRLGAVSQLVTGRSCGVAGLIVRDSGYEVAVTTQQALQRVVVVVNPARSGAVEELVALLDGRVEVEIVEPDDDLVGSIRTAADGADTVAVVGGDGSQEAAAAALAGTDTALGVVPGGTVNLLARILGVDSLESAALAIIDGSTRTIDLGDVEGSTFVLNASSGFDAAVMQRVDEGAKRWGRVGYFVTGVRALLSHRPGRVVVTVDGREWYRGRAMTVMVTNFGQRGGADLTVAPGSAPDDGELDVVVQRSDTVPTMARTIWTLQRKRTPRADDLLVGHGRRIEVDWARPTATQRDGDATGLSRRLVHEIRPARLLVRCPPNGDEGGDRR